MCVESVCVAVVCVCVMNMALGKMFVQGGAVVGTTAAHHQVTGSSSTRKAFVSFLVAS